MSDSKHKALSQQYFDVWCQKDVNKLAPLFSNDISLVDWEISAHGLFNVLEANQKIFNSVSTLEVIVTDMIEEHMVVNHKVVCLITIFIDKETDNPKVLDVVDVIHFNPNGKIESIRAYRGF